MQLDALLEVAVGLIFTWLILSVATAQVQDSIGTIFNWRANFLEESISNMLKDPELAKQLYSQPLIEVLGEVDRKGKTKKPTNIPNATFAAALLDVIMNAGKQGEEVPANTMSIAQIRAGVRRLKTENPDLARALERVLPGLEKESLELEDTIATYHKNVANWFGTVMNQASGWYKARAQTWALIIGLGISLLFNIDTLNITHQLWREPTLRAVIVAQAGTQTQVGQPQVTSIEESFEELSLPVGWTTVPAKDASPCRWPPKAANRPAIWSGRECREMTNLPIWGDFWGWIVKIFGLGISGLAAMQGAPFWFDILRKLVGFRTQLQTQTSTPQTTTPPTPPATLPAPTPSQPPEASSGGKPAG